MLELDMREPSQPMALEKLEIVPMASGHRALLLSERVSWEEFAAYAERLADALHATIADRADGPDTRVWQVTIDGGRFYLSYDDYPVSVSLEARSDEASELVPDIQRRLVWVREGSVHADDDSRPYTRVELEQASRFPDRGDRCHRCGTFVPRFAELSPHVESRLHALIRADQQMAATHELRAATGCSLRWAKIWVIHDGRAGARREGPPCPHCGKPLRTSKARQCRHCHADWH